MFFTRCIDFADEVEPIEGIWNLDEDFFMHVIIELTKKAILEAKRYQTGLVLWIDRSKLNFEKSRAAIAWRNRRLNS